MCLESIHCRILYIKWLPRFVFCFYLSLSVCCKDDKKVKKKNFPWKCINFLQLYNNNKGKCKTITIYQVAKRGSNGFHGNGDEKK